MEYLILIDTTPAGLQFTLSGSTYTAPYDFWCAANSTRQIGVPPSQRDSAAGAFKSWSDGGAVSHTITCTAPGTILGSFENSASTTGTSGVPLWAWTIVFAADALIIVVVLLRRRRRRDGAPPSGHNGEAPLS